VLALLLAAGCGEPTSATSPDARPRTVRLQDALDD
jgi:hypothetical protein